MNIGWVVGFFLGVLGIISNFTYIPMASEYRFVILALGFILVSISNSRQH